MFTTKSRKDKIVEQAQGLAQDVSDALAPHVERARDELSPRLSDARDTLATHAGEARERLVKDVLPAVQERLEDVRDQAREQAREQATTVGTRVAPVAAEARRRGSLAAAALKGEPVQQKKSGGRKWLFLAVLAGVGAFVARKLTSSGENTNWQSSYTPTPAPPAPPTPPSPAAPMAGGDVASATGAAGGDGDAAGAAPGESLADQVEEPHPVTTPDSPAETVDVSDKPDPKV